jgi:kynurenine formamidase
VSTTTDAIAALAATIESFDVVDLSPTIRSDMPRFSAHPDAQILEKVRTIEQDGYFLQTLVLPEHVGAHMDAPAHIHADRADATVDTVSPTALWGRAVSVDLSARDWEAGELCGLDEFMRSAGAPIGAGDVVLVNYGWSRHLDGGRGVPFWSSNTPGLDEDVCRELHDLGVRAVCSDSATCDAAFVDGELKAAFGHGQYFLPNDIYILECLDNLGRLPAVSYFAATPLKILGGSGSPLRPVALVPKG